MKLSKWAACLAALSAVATPAAAQEWADLRDALIDTAVESYEGEGYHVAGFTIEGSLNEGASEMIDLRLTSGHEVTVVGICDGDCGDLDLTLYNPRGAEVTSDVATDDVPIISTMPTRDGVYAVKIAMASCSVDPCYYALQAFSK